MSGTPSTRILFICYPGSDVLRIADLIEESKGALTLSQVSFCSKDIYDIPLENHDVVLLDLKALKHQDIDPVELNDALYSHIPVVLIGHSDDAPAGTEGIRDGAQDWVLYDHLSDQPLSTTIENAQRSFARIRDLVVSHAKYQNVVEDQSEFIYRCLPDCTLTFVNQAYANYLGKPVSELEGLNFKQLSKPADYETYKRKISALTPQNPTTSYEKCVVTGGDSYWLHWSERAIFDSNGVMLEVQSLGTDITVRRCAEQEALDGKKRFQSLYQNAPIMMQELDAKGRILSVNRCWLETMGQKLDDVLGLYAFRFLHASSRKTITNALDELRSVGYVRNIPCRYVNGSRNGLDVLVSATIDVNDENQDARILVVSSEIESMRKPSKAKISLRKRKSLSIAGD